MIHKPTNPKIYTPQDGSCVLNLDARDVRGSKIYDRSGKGNHGVITGAVLKPMNYGLPVLNFDGVDDKVNCGTINITGSISFAIWVKPKDLSQDSLFGRITGWSDLFEVNGGRLRMCLVCVSDNIDITSNNVVYQINKWYLFVATYDVATGIGKLYVNGIGVEHNGDIGIGIPSVNNAVDWKLGDVIPGREFIGEITKFSMFNKVLTASEISQYFNNLRHIYGI